MAVYTRPLTSSTAEHESHDRKDRLQLSPLNHPDNRHDDDSDGDQYGYDGKFLGPEPFLEFEPDWLATLAGFELGEPIDPLVGRAYAVRMVDGV